MGYTIDEQRYYSSIVKSILNTSLPEVMLTWNMVVECFDAVKNRTLFEKFRTEEMIRMLERMQQQEENLGEQILVVAARIPYQLKKYSKYFQSSNTNNDQQIYGGPLRQ